MPRRVAVLLLGLSAVLAGCHTPGGAVRQQIIVQFVTYDSGAAKTVIVGACGALPGTSVDPGRSGDPNLIFDVTHATENQVAALTACIDGLQTTQPSLRIRTVSLDNGLDN